MHTLQLIILILVALVLFSMALPILLAISAGIVWAVLTPLIWITEGFTRHIIWPYQRWHAERLGVTRPQIGILQRTHFTPWPTKEQAEAYLLWLRDRTSGKDRKKYRIRGWKKGTGRSW